MHEQPRSRRRLYVLIVLAVIIIPGTLAYIELYLSRPIGSGPAGPDLDAAAFRKTWSARNVQVVGIGDSITAGLGARSCPRCAFA